VFFIELDVGCLEQELYLLLHEQATSICENSLKSGVNVSFGTHDFKILIYKKEV
jgi:hypothetical protein